MIYCRYSNLRFYIPSVAFRIQQSTPSATLLRGYTTSSMAGLELTSKAAHDFLSFVNASPTRLYPPLTALHNR